MARRLENVRLAKRGGDDKFTEEKPTTRPGLLKLVDSFDGLEVANISSIFELSDGTILTVADANHGTDDGCQTWKHWLPYQGQLVLHSSMLVIRNGATIPLDDAGEHLTLLSSVEGRIDIWDLKEMKVVRKLEPCALANTLLTLKHHKTTSTTGRRILLSTHNAKLQVWDLDKGLSIATFDLYRRERFDFRISSLSELENGLLAIGFSDGTACISEITIGTEQADSSIHHVRTLVHHQMESHEFRFSMCWVRVLSFDSDILVTSGEMDSGVKIWKVSDGTLLHTFAHPNGVSLNKIITKGEDGSTKALLLGSDMYRFIIWDIEKKECLVSINEHKFCGCAVQLSDGLIYASRHNGSISRWEIASTK